jgi:hypothetical protein
MLPFFLRPARLVENISSVMTLTCLLPGVLSRAKSLEKSYLRHASDGLEGSCSIVLKVYYDALVIYRSGTLPG